MHLKVRFAVAGIRAALLLGFVCFAGCASSPPALPRLEIKPESYKADFETTWQAVNDVLAEQRLPVKVIEKDSGLVGTEPVGSGPRYIYWDKKRDAEGRPISHWTKETRYFLNVRVRPEADGRTTVDVLPHVEYWNFNANTWFACESHGDIEKEFYAALAKKLGG